MSVCARARVVVWKTARNSEKQALFNKNPKKRKATDSTLCVRHGHLVGQRMHVGRQVAPALGDQLVLARDLRARH